MGVDHRTWTTKYPEHRCAFSWHIWEHSVQSPESLALSRGSTIGSKGSMALGLQWGSMASTRLKGFQGVQRGSKTFKGWRGILRSGDRRSEVRFEMFGSDGVAGMQQLVRKCCTKTTKDHNTQGEIEWGVAEMQHPFFMAQHCVDLWHSKTQHLVGKKTNNFNGLAVKNRLTAVVMPLHVVA